MSLELYILRHAIAVDVGSEGIADEARPLTDEGREKMILEARGMRRLGVEIDALLSSPLLRAVQTAELVKEHLPFNGAIEIEEELGPSGSLREFLRKLGERKETRFLLVGHEPMLGSWIRSLLGCGRGARPRLKKGSLCHLALERAETGADSELIALLQPKTLRLLGRKAG